MISEFKAGAAMPTLTHAGVVGHCSTAPGPPRKCGHLADILWVFYGPVTELLEKAAGAFEEEDASFEGISGKQVLQGALVNLGSEVRLHLNS